MNERISVLTITRNEQTFSSTATPLLPSKPISFLKTPDENPNVFNHTHNLHQHHPNPATARQSHVKFHFVAVFALQLRNPRGPPLLYTPSPSSPHCSPPPHYLLTNVHRKPIKLPSPPSHANSPHNQKHEWWLMCPSLLSPAHPQPILTRCIYLPVSRRDRSRRARGRDE